MRSFASKNKKATIPDALNFAAKLEISQVPPLHLLTLQLEVVRLALEVEQWHVLDVLLHGVRHHGLAVYPEKSAPVTSIALKKVDNQFMSK